MHLPVSIEMDGPDEIGAGLEEIELLSISRAFVQR